MDVNEFSHSSFDDIVFEGRNKDYGAYRLRKLEARDILIALLIGSFLVSALIFGPLIYQRYFAPPKPPKKDPPPAPSAIAVLKPGKKEDKPKPKKPKIKIVELHQFIQYKPTQDENVHDKDPDSTSFFRDKTIGDEDREGEKGDYEDAEGTGGTGETYKEEEGFYFVDEEPQFIEGDFKLFIEKNYNVSAKIYNTGKPGTIVVSFTVERDGSVSDIYIMTAKGLTPEQDAEALRVIRLSNHKWTPGKINGEPVKTYFKQSFYFGPEVFE